MSVLPFAVCTASIVMVELRRKTPSSLVSRCILLRSLSSSVDLQQVEHASVGVLAIVHALVML
jgi:hypothetical protein